MKFTIRQTKYLITVTPRNASSGARQADAGLIKAGNPELRRVLVELAHRLISRGAPRWADLAVGMLKRGKQKNVVIAAVANRWVRWLHHELQREETATSASARARQKGTAAACEDRIQRIIGIPAGRRARSSLGSLGSSTVTRGAGSRASRTEAHHVTVPAREAKLSRRISPVIQLARVDSMGLTTANVGGEPYLALDILGCNLDR